MMNDNDINDSIFNIQNDNNYNFFSKFQQDDSFNINPYDDLDVLCQYSNINETIEKLKNKKGLKIISWNIRSLQTNFNQFKELIDLFHSEGCFLDIICLTEIWNLKDNDFYNLEHYNFVSKMRRHTTGGGVAYYIKKGIRYKEIKDLSLFEEKIIECLTLELDFGKKDKLILSNIYRSNSPHPNYSAGEQNDTFLEAFCKLQGDLSSLKHKSYIVGDMNFDLLKFEIHDKTEILLDNGFAHGFLQLVSLPTRISNNSATLIDHIYTNATLNNFETYIILSDISDHFPICHIISDKTKEKKPNYIQVQNFNEENILSFKEDLSNTNWACVFDQDHTQTAYDKFYEIFSGKYNNHFPIRNVKFNKNKHKIDPFMSSAILKSRKTKFKLSETKIRFPSQENINKYKQFRKCYNKVIRAAKKGYYKKTFDQHKNNLRKTWEVLKDAIRKKNDKSSIIEEIKSDNLFYRNDNDMSNTFNEYFTTIADKITDDLNTSDRDCTYYTNDSNFVFSFSDVFVHDVMKIVSGLESKSSQDMFGLSNFLLKKIIENIALPLSYILNLSLQSGEIPSEFKKAKVKPIFKLNSKDSDLLSTMSNYRPISLLPIFSKILEKLVALRLTKFLDENNLLYKHQYGFQRKKSTLHPMIHLLNKIAENDNEKKITIGVFCDLQKAFDCCSHKILLIKLSKLGVKGRELKWFENYLKNREQFVSVNDGNSNLRFITKGVPQGSILGPLLFLIYINDLANCTSLFTLLFADDTSFLISGKNLNEVIKLLNVELKKICYWFRTNELSLHPGKTKFMIFTKNESNINFDELNIVLNNNNVDENDENNIIKLSYVNSNSEIPAIKFLGVHIDPKLNFKHHIGAIHSKVSRSLFAINSVKHFIDKRALKTLYNSLVHSHFLYCIPIWGCASKSSFKKLELLQKKAIRTISLSKYNAHTVPIFKKIEILPIKEQAILSSLLIMYDYVHQKLPYSFDQLWRKNNARANRVLRNANLFDIPYVRLESQKNFPISSFPRLWNEIIIPNTEQNDDNVEQNFTFREIMSRKQFASQLKLLLLDNLTLVCSRDNCSECNQ